MAKTPPCPGWWLPLATAKIHTYCPVCGSRVLKPCVACAARLRKRCPEPDRWDEPLELDLNSEDLERFQRLGGPGKSS